MDPKVVTKFTTVPSGIKLLDPSRTVARIVSTWELPAIRSSEVTVMVIVVAMPPTKFTITGELVMPPALAVIEALPTEMLEVRVAVAEPLMVKALGVMDPAVVVKVTRVPSGTGVPVLSFTKAVMVAVDVPLATIEELLVLTVTVAVTMAVNSTVWVLVKVLP